MLINGAPPNILKPPLNGFPTEISPTKIALRKKYEGYTSKTELCIARFLQRKGQSFYYEFKDKIFEGILDKMHFDIKIEKPIYYNKKKRFKALVLEIDGDNHREDPYNPGYNIYGVSLRRIRWNDSFKDVWSLMNGILLIRIDDYNNKLHATSKTRKQDPILFVEDIIKIFDWIDPITILDSDQLKYKQAYLQYWIEHVAERPRNIDKEEVRKYVNFIIQKYYKVGV